MAVRLALAEAAGHRPGPLALVPEILPIESQPTVEGFAGLNPLGGQEGQDGPQATGSAQ